MCIMHTYVHTCNPIKEKRGRQENRGTYIQKTNFVLRCLEVVLHLTYSTYPCCRKPDAPLQEIHTKECENKEDFEQFAIEELKIAPLS